MFVSSFLNYLKDIATIITRILSFSLTINWKKIQTKKTAHAHSIRSSLHFVINICDTAMRYYSKEINNNNVLNRNETNRKKRPNEQKWKSKQGTPKNNENTKNQWIPKTVFSHCLSMLVFFFLLCIILWKWRKWNCRKILSESTNRNKFRVNEIFCSIFCSSVGCRIRLPQLSKAFSAHCIAIISHALEKVHYLCLWSKVYIDKD